MSYDSQYILNNVYNVLEVNFNLNSNNLFFYTLNKNFEEKKNVNLFLNQ